MSLFWKLTFLSGGFTSGMIRDMGLKSSRKRKAITLL